MPTRYRVAAPSRAWRPAPADGIRRTARRSDSREATAVTTRSRPSFSEILGLTLKVFGDLSGHSELVVRGSLSDHNLLGFYLQQGRLVATLAVGQEKQTERGTPAFGLSSGSYPIPTSSPTRQPTSVLS